LGRLGELAEWVAGVQGQCPTRPLQRVRLVTMSGDQPAGTDVSALAGLFHTGVRSVVVGDGFDQAGTRADPAGAFEAGMAVVDDEVDSGADLLVVADLGVESTVAAATVVAVLTGADVASVIGRGTGIDDREWMRRCAAVRDTARLARRVLTDGGDVIDLLSAAGGAGLAAVTGFLTQAAIRRTPAVLDGLVTTAAALVAHRLSPRITRWLTAAHASPDPGQAVALDKLRLRPLIDYRISLDDGTGALLAVPHLQAAAALLS
jgi:nicotinate-nucleotide--dimethylbenzimidazole phosphoribosyltransferase